MIIFDSSFLVVLLYPTPPPCKDRADQPVTQFKDRVAYLASTMDIKNEVIGVPAPAMAEVLVRAGKGRAQYASILSKSWRFQILPFDSRAAIEAAELIEKIKSNSQPWGTWAKVKFDIQIVAIAKAESATAIYSDDKDVENYAKRLKIPVIRVCDLPLPPAQTDTPIDTGPVGSQGTLPLMPAPAQESSDKPTSAASPERLDSSKVEERTATPLAQAASAIKEEDEGQKTQPPATLVQGSSERPAESKTAAPIRSIRLEDEEESKTKEVGPEMPKPADKGGPDKGSS